MEINREKFINLYNKMSNADLANKLGVSVGTIKNLIKRYDIPAKGKGNRNPKSIIRIVS